MTNLNVVQYGQVSESKLNRTEQLFTLTCCVTTFWLFKLKDAKMNQMNLKVCSNKAGIFCI